MRRFITINDRYLHGGSAVEAGAVVYEFKHDDFGLAQQESRLVGVPFISVTLREDGAYPSFTIPVEYLHELTS